MVAAPGGPAHALLTAAQESLLDWVDGLTDEPGWAPTIQCDRSVDCDEGGYWRAWQPSAEDGRGDLHATRTIASV